MRPILSLNDQRVNKFKGIFVLLATTGSKRRVFELGDLPLGWKPVKVLRADLPGLTIGQLVTFMNNKLSGRLPTTINEGDRVYDKVTMSSRLVKSISANVITFLDGSERNTNEVFILGRI